MRLSVASTGGGRASASAGKAARRRARYSFTGSTTQINYSLGKLQILKLRDDYKRQEGANFSLQKFNDEMTNHGMPPIGLLREIMLKDKTKWDAVL